MRVKKTETIETEVTTDVICNACGNSCIDRCDMNYEGLIEATVYCGYGSDYFGDMVTLCFSLCEKCLHDYSQKWVHSPIVYDPDEFDDLTDGIDKKIK